MNLQVWATVAVYAVIGAILTAALLIGGPLGGVTAYLLLVILWIVFRVASRRRRSRMSP